MPPPAGSDRVHGGLTQPATGLMAKIVRDHARLQRKPNGQLPFAGRAEFSSVFNMSISVMEARRQRD
jgi:hypothetical protein